MKKFMNFKHKVAEAIDNLGKNTILIATEKDGGFTFEQIRTESSEEEVKNACKQCPGQYLITFNGKLVMEGVIVYNEAYNPSEEEFEEYTEEPVDECTETN
jgi:hypothetical protein